MTGTIPGNDGEQSARDGRDDAEWILKIKFIQEDARVSALG